MTAELLSKIMYDQWTFSGFCRLGVVSHTHEDHDPSNLEPMWVPEEIYTPVFFQQVHHPEATAVKVVKGKEGRRLNRDCRGWPLGYQAVNKILGAEKNEPTHAAWWVLRASGRVVLFVGELDAPEVSVLEELADVAKPDILIVPVYGDIQEGEHRTKYPSELREKINEFAKKWADEGNEIWALPHVPTGRPEWATRLAERLPKR